MPIATASNTSPLSQPTRWSCIRCHRTSLHDGSLTTLEEMFNPARLQDDFVPTGFMPFGQKTRAVKGHEFGLKLPVDEKAALVAFLRSL